MDHHSKTKGISKSNQDGQQRKPYRPTFNNNNPYNKLSLNKYHQIQDDYKNDSKKSDANKLHKRKRDLQRMIKHCEEKGIEVDKAKKEELESIQNQVGTRRKKYEKEKRKEYFLDQKYADIKRIELRKVYKHLGETKANAQMTEQQKTTQLHEWQKKLRYIKHFPKTLKYISLFPSNKPLQEKTIAFQQKIMNDIEQQNKKRVQRLNYYKSQNDVRGKPNKKEQHQGQNQVKIQKKKKKESILPLTTKQVMSKNGKKKKKVVDDFFVQEEQNDSNQQLQVEQDVDSDQEQIQQQNDEDVEIDDQDDMESQEDEQSQQ